MAVTNANEDAIGDAFAKAFANYPVDQQNALDSIGGGPISDWLNVFKRIGKVSWT